MGDQWILKNLTTKANIKNWLQDVTNNVIPKIK
jgi:hypothetical protein